MIAEELPEQRGVPARFRRRVKEGGCKAERIPEGRLRLLPGEGAHLAEWGVEREDGVRLHPREMRGTRRMMREGGKRGWII